VRARRRDHRTYREGPQRVGDRERAFRRVLPPREGEDVGATLALGVQVDSTDEVRQHVAQTADGDRIAAEERGLLAVGTLGEPVEHLGDVVEARDRDDGAELLLGVERHPGLHAAYDGGKIEGLAVDTGVLIDDLGALSHGVVDEGLEAGGLALLRQRRELNARLPRCAEAELVDCGGEAIEEGRLDLAVDPDELQASAALTIVGERARDALLHGEVEVGVREDDGRVLRLEAEDAAHPVQFWMLALQDVGHSRSADERERREGAGLE